jgi:hypothetical protein
VNDFTSFVHKLHSLLPSLEKHSEIDLALYRYAKESAMYGEVIDLMMLTTQG